MDLVSGEYAWEILTPQDGHYMFGYYDRTALSPDNRRHLALHIPQQERLPEIGETADVGYIDVEKKTFVRLAHTQSWCHQQGAMTLWLKHLPGHFIYNDYVEDRGGWRAVCRICNADTGEIADGYDRPVYQLSPCGCWGGVLDFARIPRRGYSYARAVLPAQQKTPDLDGDGLFLMDMQTGACSLVASYRQMIEAIPCAHDLEGRYVWLNHIIFNKDSSRVGVLLRYRSEACDGDMWKTNMLTMDLDGDNMLCPLPQMLWEPGAISHQLWGRTPREIVIDANWCGNGHEYIVFDEDKIPLQTRQISKGMGPMAHLNFSPDGKWLAADTYPVDGWQRLAVISVATGALTQIGRFRHPEVSLVDVRCDLHSRWSADGRYLTVDTIHTGKRAIGMFDMTSLV